MTRKIIVTILFQLIAHFSTVLQVCCIVQKPKLSVTKMLNLQQICCTAKNKLAVLHAAYLQCCNPVLQSGANFTQVLDCQYSIFLCTNRKLKIYEEQELTMKIFAEPSEFQMPPDNSSLRQHNNSIAQNLFGMETPPVPLLIDGN
jgi:hypothetical protein